MPFFNKESICCRFFQILLALVLIASTVALAFALFLLKVNLFNSEELTVILSNELR